MYESIINNLSSDDLKLINNLDPHIGNQLLRKEVANKQPQTVYENTNTVYNKYINILPKLNGTSSNRLKEITVFMNECANLCNTKFRDIKLNRYLTEIYIPSGIRYMGIIENSVTENVNTGLYDILQYMYNESMTSTNPIDIRLICVEMGRLLPELHVENMYTYLNKSAYKYTESIDGIDDFMFDSTCYNILGNINETVLPILLKVYRTNKLDHFTEEVNFKLSSKKQLMIMHENSDKKFSSIGNMYNTILMYTEDDNTHLIYENTSGDIADVIVERSIGDDFIVTNHYYNPIHMEAKYSVRLY